MSGDYNTLTNGAYQFPIAESYGIKGNVLMIRRSLTPRIKGKFEDWLELTARQRVFFMREKLGTELYKESMRAVQEACAGGSFRWMGDACRAACQAVPGVVMMLTLLAQDCGQLDVDEGKILELLEDESIKDELNAALKEVLNPNPNFYKPPLRDRTTGEVTAG